jgi:hypothetical protein
MSSRRFMAVYVLGSSAQEKKTMIQITGLETYRQRTTPREPTRLFLVRRVLPGPRSLSPEETLRAACQSTGTAAKDLRWIDGIATANSVLLLYAAPREETVRRHTELAGLAAAEIVEVRHRLGAGGLAA